MDKFEKRNNRNTSISKEAKVVPVDDLAIISSE